MAFALSAICMTAATFSQTEETQKTDTLLNLTGTPKVTILERPEGITLLANDSIGNLSDSISISYPTAAVVTTRQADTKYDRKNVGFRPDKVCKNIKSKWSAVMSGICLGLSDPVGQTCGGGLEWSKSIEIGWFQCLGVSYELNRYSWLSLGIGFDWRNYKITTSDKRLIVNSDHQLEWGAYPESSIPRNSRLKVFSLQFPLMFTGRIPGTSLLVEAGPIFNFNTYCSVLTCYEDISGNKYKDFTKYVDNRLFTVDLFGCVSLKNGIGIYARYSPMKVMNGNSGINFSPLTIGFIIGCLSL